MISIAIVSVTIGIVSILLGMVIQISLKSMYKVLCDSLITETSLPAQIGGFIGMVFGMTVIVQLPMIAIPHVIIYSLFRYTAIGSELVHSLRTDTPTLVAYIALYAIMMPTAYMRDQLKSLMKYMGLSVKAGNTRQVIYVALMTVVYMTLVLGTAAFFILQVAKLTSL